MPANRSPQAGRSDAPVTALSPYADIPVAARSMPLLGHTNLLLREPLAFFSALPRQGDLVRVRLGPFEAVVVCDPELTRKVLRDDRSFDKGGQFFHRVREVLGDGLASSSHVAHRRQRRLCQPAFHSARMPAYGKAMTARIVEVTSSWTDGQALDVLTEMQKITLAILTGTLFSDTLSRSAMDRFTDDMATILAGIFRRMLMPRWVAGLPLPVNRRHEQAIASMRATAASVIAERRSGVSVNTDDLLSALLDSYEADGERGGPADDEIVDHILTFLIAGTETAAATLAWALHLVVNDPSVARRLQVELDTVLAGRTEAVHADLPRLELTRAIVSETLRIRPPAWLFSRTATADVELGGYLVPAGTTIVYSPYLIHHRADLFRDPDTFDPDRWIGDANNAQERRSAIPFGGGARKCIGDNFGSIEVALTLATIAHRWNLTPVPGKDVRPVATTTLRPVGLTLRVTARKNYSHS